MKERAGSARTGPISKVFEYCADVEKYPERYPTYSARVVVTKKDENSIITEEIWNVTIGDLQYIKVKVKYTLTHYNKIEFEILDGYGKGVKNAMIFNDLNNGTIGCSLTWVPLEVIAQLTGEENPLITKMIKYFIRRDVENYEGRQVETKAGDSCPFCEVGTLAPTGKFMEQDKTNEYQSDREFQCDNCRRITQNHETHVRQKIGIG